MQACYEHAGVHSSFFGGVLNFFSSDLSHAILWLEGVGWYGNEMEGWDDEVEAVVRLFSCPNWLNWSTNNLIRDEDRKVQVFPWLPKPTNP